MDNSTDPMGDPMADPTAFTVTIDCGGMNDYDGRIGLRISAIFVIGLGSMLGVLFPIVAARSKRLHVPKLAFFVAKYFGSGVIIATAFIHLLAPANDALTSPCLSGAITDYDWVEGIALMTVFTMFFVELMASRFEVFALHEDDLESADPSKDLLKESREKEAPGTNQTDQRQAVVHAQSSSDGSERAKESASRSPGIPIADGDISYPPGGEDHLGHHRHHHDSAEAFAAQMTSLFILEFGVIFHSIFIGLTLAVAGDEFNILYIVLVFHQTFEGLGLGARLGQATWPKKKAWLPWVLGIAYGITTPLAIAVGLGVRATFEPGDPTTLLVNGVFDSISAGILIYTGLVELMAHEFMFNQAMRRSSMKMTLFAFGCMCLGAGLMALLGKWA